MKYQIIYIDPPWSYKDKALAGNRGACCKYQTLDINYLKQLCINDIADTDCTLFMWVTMPKLNECFELFESWGFKYKTCAFTWIKRNKTAPTLFWGLGRWTRSNAELCLLGVKGRPKRINAGVHSVVYTPVQQHSRKPDEVRKRILSLLGDLPRIELFARQKTAGWDSIGYDIDGMDIKDSLEKIIKINLTL